MKLLLLSILIITPFFVAAQKVKTRIQFQSRLLEDDTAKKQMEEIIHYSVDSLIEKIETNTIDVSNNGIKSIEFYNYNADRTIKSILQCESSSITKAIDSATCVQNYYNYLPNNVVEKTTVLANGTSTTTTFIVDANGKKIFDNYNYQLDKKKRLILKYRKVGSKKTARVEKYSYMRNNKLESLKVIVANKAASITTYFYNEQGSIIKEITKNIGGKKVTFDEVYYEYTNNLLTKEISVTPGLPDTIVEYSYTFYE
jgi:hypothetical protein